MRYKSFHRDYSHSLPFLSSLGVLCVRRVCTAVGAAYAAAAVISRFWTRPQNNVQTRRI